MKWRLPKADSRYASSSHGYDRDNNRCDPDREDDVVLGKKRGSPLLDRSRFAPVGRFMRHRELPYFKTFLTSPPDLHPSELPDQLRDEAGRSDRAVTDMPHRRANRPRAPRGMKRSRAWRVISSFAFAPPSESIGSSDADGVFRTRPMTWQSRVHRMGVGTFADWTALASGAPLAGPDRLDRRMARADLAEPGSMLTIN